MRTWLITGGAGFIGSNFARRIRAKGAARIVNLDKLTYAGHRENLDSLVGDDGHIFIRGDIRDRGLVRELLTRYQPTAVINFAAESHVDRSIMAPEDFLGTNIGGTLALLEESLRFWRALSAEKAQEFRFLQISTDEVFGSLEPGDAPFTETHPFAPNSPYAASKAGADHMVRAYHATFGLPTLTTHCSNNYGPYQHPEKLIPLMILNAWQGLPLPVYGDGRQIRDWLYVDDHCGALEAVLAGGAPGGTYNIGGDSERSNLDIIRLITERLDALHPAGAPHAQLIKHVQDRPGHDRRYAINADKMRRDLQWRPRVTLEEGLRRTVEWYVERTDWVQAVCGTAHQKWVAQQYGAGKVSA